MKTNRSTRQNFTKMKSIFFAGLVAFLFHGGALAYGDGPWSYLQFEDKLTGKKSYEARTNSLNTINLGFPYSGIQNAQLTLRTHPVYGKDLIFSIDKGQLICRSYRGCEVLVRFDDGQPVKYSASPPSDHSTETLFIRNYSGFAGKMLKAKRVVIGVNIYQNGTEAFEFDVSNFSVEKYRPKNK